MSSKSVAQYIKERNTRFNNSHPHYRQYAYLVKKLQDEIAQLPSELKEKYNDLHYTEKYDLLKNVNSMIKGIGKDNVGSYLQSVLIQHFSKIVT